MPLLGLLLLNAVLGLAAAAAAAGELRASPRPAHESRAFAALGLHQLVASMPVLAWFLVRHGDWMFCYVLDAARLPSAAVLALVVVHGGCAMASFVVGARWLRDHHPRRIAVVAAVLAALALLSVVFLRERLAVAGTYVQFRGGFGLRPLWGSGTFAAVVVLGPLYLLAAGHLFWSLRTHLSRAPEGISADAK